MLRLFQHFCCASCFDFLHVRYQKWSPREHNLKSLALALKPQVLENCPVLGLRTVGLLFFEPLKLCITIIINGQRCKRICNRLVKSTYTLRRSHLGPLQLSLQRCCSLVWFGYWSNSESLPASFNYVARLLMLHIVTTSSTVL